MATTKTRRLRSSAAAALIALVAATGLTTLAAPAANAASCGYTEDGLRQTYLDWYEFQVSFKWIPVKNYGIGFVQWMATDSDNRYTEHLANPLGDQSTVYKGDLDALHGKTIAAWVYCEGNDPKAPGAVPDLQTNGVKIEKPDDYDYCVPPGIEIQPWAAMKHEENPLMLKLSYKLPPWDEDRYCVDSIQWQRAEPDSPNDFKNVTNMASPPVPHYTNNDPNHLYTAEFISDHLYNVDDVHARYRAILKAANTPQYHDVTSNPLTIHLD